MRIISGVLKGRSINFIKNSNTRPLKDLVKESIFNILRHSKLINAPIENSSILDLYSGIGSFGIECISRGAKKVTFIEQDLNASTILTENLIKLSITNRSVIINKKIEIVLNENLINKFNIFFLDPPFKDLNFLKNIELIKKNRIFKSNHIVIIHRERNSKENFDKILKIVETKQYGRSKIIFGVFN